MPNKWRWLIALIGITIVLCAAAGAVLCESAIRVPKRPPPAVPFEGARWRAIVTTADDGAVLRAWLILPAMPTSNCILVLHGIADSRASQMGLARLFLANGYTVLAPDSRGHGESGGDIVTYGLREAGDIHRWVDWLVNAERPRNVFGMGESLGAGVLLQSLAVEHRFAGVVAECPFASFERVAEDRVVQRLPLPPRLGYLFAKPMVWSGFLYARARYGLDYRKASPEDVISRVSTPVLLIHGLDDTNIYPEHSRILAGRDPQAALWLVPGARHTAAFGAAPEEFPRRVLAWFHEHSR